MRISLLILILALTLIKSQAQSCVDNCQPLSYYGCTVCFNNCGGTYTFKNCLQKYCSQYYYYYSNGKRRKTCGLYSYYSFTEQGCIASCCGDAGLGHTTMDQDFWGTCVAENNRLSHQLAIILGSVFGSIALIFISVGVYLWRKNR